MSRMLGYTLMLGGFDAWSGFSTVAAVHLDASERGAMAFAALRSLPSKQAEITAATALGSAGGPLPSFLGGMDDARFWASLANRLELKAYALAAFEAMGRDDQAAFFQHISELEISA